MNLKYYLHISGFICGDDILGVMSKYWKNIFGLEPALAAELPHRIFSSPCSQPQASAWGGEIIWLHCSLLLSQCSSSSYILPRFVVHLNFLSQTETNSSALDLVSMSILLLALSLLCIMASCHYINESQYCVYHKFFFWIIVIVIVDCYVSLLIHQLLLFTRPGGIKLRYHPPAAR